MLDGMVWKVGVISKQYAVPVPVAVVVVPVLLMVVALAPASPLTPSSKLTNEPMVGTLSDVLISTLLLTTSILMSAPTTSAAGTKTR